MSKKIAINGFGRIGRTFFRQAFNCSDFDIVAINDLGDLDNLAYLLKHDSVYREFEGKVETKSEGEQKYLTVSNPSNSSGSFKKILFLNEKDPANLPWKDLKIDVVVESTGFFTTLEKAKPHIEAGAKRVVITAPAKDDVTPTATPNVGEEFLKNGQITSNASCTTNAATPVMAVMMINPGIEKALLNTVHGYTASQGLVDGPVKGSDFRKGRAAATNLVPTDTGAAIATTKAIPHMAGKFDGIAIRVPLVTGSLIDFTFLASKKTSVEEVNNLFKEAASSDTWKGILTVVEDPIVSSDIIGNPHGSIVDLSMTKVVGDDLVKILAWYDNEWGYCSMLLKHVQTLIKMI
jgi:glyceraldehyde 3-phosphate dehydrogenase